MIVVDTLFFMKRECARNVKICKKCEKCEKPASWQKEGASACLNLTSSLLLLQVGSVEDAC